MSFVMSKGKFERTAFFSKRLRLVEMPQLIASPNKIDLNVVFWWCGFPLMNCLLSAVGFKKSCHLQ